MNGCGLSFTHLLWPKIWSITSTACKHRDKRFSLSLVIVTLEENV